MFTINQFKCQKNVENHSHIFSELKVTSTYFSFVQPTTQNTKKTLHYDEEKE